MNELKWKPQKLTFSYITSESDRYLGFKKFRNSSSAYIKKLKVKEFIFSNQNHCVICASDKDLQIDHKKSVYQCFKDKEYNFCNSISNLQVLCRKCNAGKQP